MICPVPARAVNQQWVEEYRVSGLHDKMNSRSIGIVVTNAMVQFVHSALRCCNKTQY